MRLSVLLYGGLCLVVAGVLMLVFRRTRRRGAMAACAGLTAVIIAIAWPAEEKRVRTPTSRIDDSMPMWQFDEVHTAHVDAPPERVFDATHAVTAREILFFRTLTAIRRGFSDPAPSIMNAPADESLLHIATRTSFAYLADERPREIVVQTRIARGVTAVMNFLITSDGGGGSNISTTTRVYAETAAGKRQFAAYWRMIHPGSDIIRRMWLRAIKRRAERAVG